MKQRSGTSSELAAKLDELYAAIQHLPFSDRMEILRGLAEIAGGAAVGQRSSLSARAVLIAEMGSQPFTMSVGDSRSSVRFRHCLGQRAFGASHSRLIGAGAAIRPCNRLHQPL
jgi:hypothetical protein